MIRVYLLCVALLLGVTAGADWPQWGGVNGDFSVAGSAAIPAWGEDGPIEVWSRLLGSGNSGIAVVDGVLYTQYRERLAGGGSGMEEIVVALDASDGRTLWTYRYEAPPYPGQELFSGTGPHATPLVVGERLLTVGFTGHLMCLARQNGRLLWSVDLVEDLGADKVQFGFAGSPVVYNEAVIVPAAGARGGLAALAIDTGEVLWRSPPAPFSYATPVKVRYGGEDQFVWLAGDAVEGIAAATGQRRWRHALPEKDMTNVPTPLWLGDGQVLVAGQGMGGTALLRLSGPPDRIKVKRVWRSSRVNYFHSNALRLGDTVVAGDNFLYGLDWRRGKRLWAARGYRDAKLVRVGASLLLLSIDGLLTLADLGPEGVRPLAQTRLFEGDAWTTPSVVGTRLYARNREMVVALDWGPGAVALGTPSPRQARLGFRQAYEAGGLDAAVKYWRRDAASGGGGVDAALAGRWIDELARDRRFEDAVRLAAAGVEILGATGPNLKRLATAQLVAGDQAAARASLGAALEQAPTDAEVVAVLGQLDPAATGGRVFRLPGYGKARMVTLAGSFNNWDARRNFCRRDGDGWACRVDLAPGEHVYKFVVDGQKWILDPQNSAQRADGNGNVNSLVVVKP